MLLPLSPQVFAILSGLVEERTGLHYGPEKQELFAERVSPRAIDLGHGSLLDYYYQLRYDDPEGLELQRLTELLVVHETFLFRELDQLRVVSDLLAEQVRAAGHARVWSAACATGEEPLSLAILLEERGLLGQVSILATDISRRALDRAQSGRLGQRALRGAPAQDVLARWVRPAEQGLQVERALVERINWARLNLAEPLPDWLGSFDLILCRNVLIYFQDAIASRVVSALSARLAAGGALFVGVSESLVRLGASLECRERDGVFFYARSM